MFTNKLGQSKISEKQILMIVKYSDMIIVCVLLPSIYYSIASPVITLLKAIPHQ